MDIGEKFARGDALFTFYFRSGRSLLVFENDFKGWDFKSFKKFPHALAVHQHPNGVAVEIIVNPKINPQAIDFIYPVPEEAYKMIAAEFTRIVIPSDQGKDLIKELDQVNGGG